MKMFKETFLLLIGAILFLSFKISAQATNRDIVKGMYDSFSTGNVPAVLDAMDPNIVWNEAENVPYADRNPYIGPTAVLEGLFYRLGSEWDYFTLSDIELHETNDDMVIAAGHYNGKYKKTGKVVKAQFAHHWTLENGKVTKFQQYTDTYQFNKALEKMPEDVTSLKSEDMIDAAKVDPKHYKVEFENDKVRVLRITYEPGEKSVMHSHPEGVAIFMTDGEGRFTFPDGKTQDNKFKAGKVIWTPETKHQPENTGKKPFEVIQIEMKSK